MGNRGRTALEKSLGIARNPLDRTEGGPAVIGWDEPEPDAVGAKVRAGR